MDAGTAVEVESLSKRYKLGEAQELGYRTLRDAIAGIWKRSEKRVVRPDLWALRDVSFTVPEGQALGIIGRNGAGKSTLLKILSRITEPTSGRARMRGRVASLLEIGTGFHPELTGRENIFLSGAILGMSRAQVKRNFDDIVAFAELEKFLDTPVKRYSSGMYVRLAFAVAAHLTPEILIVDEVLAVGDAQFQRRCLGRMSEVAHSGRTVLFVSHNMQAIRSLCQRALWLVDGKVRRDGSSDMVTEDYLSSTHDASEVSDAASQVSRLPEDPDFKLLGVALLQDGLSTTSVLSGKAIVARMKYSVPRDLLGLHVYIRLYDDEQTLLFESLHNGAVEGIPLVPAGTFVSEVLIPPDFLAAGIYDLEFNSGIMGDRFTMAWPIKVSFEVHAAGLVNRAYPGYGTRGKVAPLLEWETTRVNSELVDSTGAKSDSMAISENRNDGERPAAGR